MKGAGSWSLEIDANTAIRATRYSVKMTVRLNVQVG